MQKKSAGEASVNPKLQGIFGSFSEKYQTIERKLLIFMDKYVYPNENAFFDGIPHETEARWKHVSPVLKSLQAKAKAEGLWNLFLPSVSGLKNIEYAPLCEIMVRFLI